MNIIELILFIAFFAISFIIGHFVTLKMGFLFGILAGAFTFLIIVIIIFKIGKYFDDKHSLENSVMKEDNGNKNKI